MQLSTKGRYAVMAMTELAGRGEGRAVCLADIAEKQKISRPYLEQLFASGPDALGSTMAGRAEELFGNAAVVSAAVAALAADLLAALTSR